MLLRVDQLVYLGGGGEENLDHYLVIYSPHCTRARIGKSASSLNARYLGLFYFVHINGRLASIAYKLFLKTYPKLADFREFNVLSVYNLHKRC